MIGRLGAGVINGIDELDTLDEAEGVGFGRLYKTLRMLRQLGLADWPKYIRCMVSQSQERFP
jgi:hypothetical protein